MSEEQLEQEGTWSGLKKTIIGTVSTIILGAGTWVGTTLFGGGSEEAQAPAQTAAPVINLNLQNNNTQTQAQGGNTTIIKEKVVEKPAAPAPAPKKKEGDEFKEQPAQW
jgi:hypothetical protein